MEKRPFNELGLSASTLKAVEKLGFEEASPIQSAAIPLLLEGKDLVGQSQTGSGKTAAFVIPALEKLDESLKQVQVLILCPARELAMQVAEEVHRLAAFKPKVHAVPIFGGASYDRQFYELKRGPQVVIGTPGRVMDLMDRRALDLSRVKMVILDECDRMLDMGFREDMEHILAQVPAERQTVFFSATLPAPIRDLIGRFSKDAQHVRIAPKEVAAPTVEQIYYETPPRYKADALMRLIDMQDIRLGIIFCNTQRTVDDLTDLLQARGYSADRLHGGLSQAVRTRTIEKFRKSAFDLLVATDVAGRGLDVEELDLVVNYDLPWDPEDYVHRIGRTGRAGRKGLAITLVSGREIYKMQAIERFTRNRVRRGVVPTLDQVEQKRAGAVLDKVRERLRTGRFKPQDMLVEQLLEEGHSSTDIASALFHELLAASGFEPSTASAKGEKPARATAKAAAPAPVSKKDAAVEPPVAVAESAVPAGVPVEENGAGEKPAPAPVPGAETAAPAKPKKEKPAARSASPEDFGDAEEDDFDSFGRGRPVADSRGSKKAAAGDRELVSLPAPARGFQWVRVNLGKNHGFGPRDIVDLFAAGAMNFPPQAVGQIKLLDDQSFAQVHGSHVRELLDDMEGAEYEGRPLKVTFAARGATGGARGPARAGAGRPPYRDAPAPARGGSRYGAGGYRKSGPGGFGGGGGGFKSAPAKPAWKKARRD